MTVSGSLIPLRRRSHSATTSVGVFGRSCTFSTTRGATSRPRTGTFDTITANPAAFTGSTSPLGAAIPALFRASSMTVDAVMKCHPGGFSIWTP
jgi:hypothetical protein